ncbi:MAG: hypothetical protein ABI822_24455, partial [Bryobacteraceae bacterium]
ELFEQHRRLDHDSVADDRAFSKTPFLQAKSLHIGVELKPLIFSRQLNVTALTVDQPDINLLQSASGEWNFSTIGVKAAAWRDPLSAPAQKIDLSVKLIQITDGRLTIDSARDKTKPQTFEHVNAEVKDFSAASSFPFSVSTKLPGSGEAEIHGTAGPINASDFALTPVDATAAIRHVELKGPGFTGVLAVDGDGTLGGSKLHTRGQIKAERWKVATNGSPSPKPIEFDFQVDHDLQRRAGVLNRGEIRSGKLQAALSGAYTIRDDSPALHMKFAGSNMPVSEIEAMLPALGIVLPSGASLQGGTANAHLTLEGPADQMVTAGTLSLSQTRLAGFDLGSKLKTVAALAGIKVNPNTDIQTFSADVRRAPEGTRAEAINLVVPEVGDLTGAGFISPTHDLDFKMKVKLHTSGGLMAAMGQKGDTTIPFFIRGTGSAPTFIPDARGIVSEKVNTFLKGDDPAKAAKGLLEGFFGKKKTN